MTTPPTVSPLPDQLQSYVWADEFRIFTSFHWVVLLVCSGTMILCCVIGNRMLRKGEDREEGIVSETL